MDVLCFEAPLPQGARLIELLLDRGPRLRFEAAEPGAPFDFQLEAEDFCVEKVGQADNVVLALPRGCGKTRVAAATARRLGAKTLVLTAPGLAGQVVAEFESAVGAETSFQLVRVTKLWERDRPLVVNRNLPGVAALCELAELVVVDEVPRQLGPVLSALRRLRRKTLFLVPGIFDNLTLFLHLRLSETQIIDASYILSKSPRLRSALAMPSPAVIASRRQAPGGARRYFARLLHLTLAPEMLQLYAFAPGFRRQEISCFAVATSILEEAHRQGVLPEVDVQRLARLAGACTAGLEGAGEMQRLRLERIRTEMSRRRIRSRLAESLGEADFDSFLKLLSPKSAEVLVETGEASERWLPLTIEEYSVLYDLHGSALEPPAPGLALPKGNFWTVLWPCESKDEVALWRARLAGRIPPEHIVSLTTEQSGAQRSRALQRAKGFNGARANIAVLCRGLASSSQGLQGDVATFGHGEFRRRLEELLAVRKVVLVQSSIARGLNLQRHVDAVQLRRVPSSRFALQSACDLVSRIGAPREPVSALVPAHGGTLDELFLRVLEWDEERGSPFLAPSDLCCHPDFRSRLARQSGVVMPVLWDETFFPSVQPEDEA